MLTKLLKVCSLPGGRKHTTGINLKGDYLTKHGFHIGDYVNVEVSENRIVITKNTETNIVSLFSRKNPILDKLVKEFELTADQRHE